MTKEFHVFWAGNVWKTEEIDWSGSSNPGFQGPIRFSVDTKDGKFKCTLVTFDFITEKLSDIVIPTLAKA